MEWKIDILDLDIYPLTYFLKNGNLRRIPKHLELGMLCSGVSMISHGVFLKMPSRSLGGALQVSVQLSLLGFQF